MKYNFVKNWYDTAILVQKNENFEKTYEELPGGIYSISYVATMMGTKVYFNPIVTPDKLVNFSSPIINDIMKKTDKFFSKPIMEKYKELGIGHKLGMIFYGPQGTGKTSTVFLLMQNLIDRYKAICIIATRHNINEVASDIRNLRKIQSNPIVLFVDEVDSSMRQQEEQYLVFLDGEQSLEKIIFIGCTNNLDKIPDRIKKRPSRIKYLYEIDRFPLEVYKQYIETKIPFMNKDVLSEIAYKASENKFSIDELKHFLIDYHIDGLKIDDIIASVKGTVKASVVKDEDSLSF